MGTFVIEVNDVTAPVFTSCSSIEVDADEGADGAQVIIPEMVATEPNLSYGGYSVGVEGHLYFPVGTTTLIYTATDPSQNVGTCEITVTVRDNEDPWMEEVGQGCSAGTIRRNSQCAGRVVEFFDVDGVTMGRLRGELTEPLECCEGECTFVHQHLSVCK